MKAVVVPFGEKIHFLTAPDKNNKKLVNWKSGVYIGTTPRLLSSWLPTRRAFAL